MRTFTTTFLILFTMTASAQPTVYTIDTSLATKYLQQKNQIIALGTEPAHFNQSDNLALSVDGRVDTLNKADFIPQDAADKTTVTEIIDTDSAGNIISTRYIQIISVEEEWDNDGYPTWLNCNCQLVNDSLTIKLTTHSDHIGIDIHISDKAAKAGYFQKEFNEMFMLQPTDRPTNRLEVPATVTHIALDRKLSPDAKEIFVGVSLTTAPYYEVMEKRIFRKGYRHQQRSISMIIRCNLRAGTDQSL